RNQLVLATSDGWVHAFRSDGSELPGWPVHTAQLPLHGAEPAYGSVGTSHYCAVLGALAGGDLFGDGRIEIVADDLCGHLYAWKPSGTNQAGSSLPGFPVLVADPDKLTAVDAITSHLTFSTTRAKPDPGIDEDQGKLIDTPAVADIGGKPTIVVGSNEEYGVNTGDEGGINAGDLTSASLGLLGQTGVLSFANGRVYAIKPTGGRMECSGGTCQSAAFEPGWPKKVGIIDAGLLP